MKTIACTRLIPRPIRAHFAELYAAFDPAVRHQEGELSSKHEEEPKEKELPRFRPHFLFPLALACIDAFYGTLGLYYDSIIRVDNTNSTEKWHFPNGSNESYAFAFHRTVQPYLWELYDFIWTTNYFFEMTIFAFLFAVCPNVDPRRHQLTINNDGNASSPQIELNSIGENSNHRIA